MDHALQRIRNAVGAGAEFPIQVLAADGTPVNTVVTKRPVGVAELEHYPRLTGEHPTRWEFPASLDNPNCQWLQALKALYHEPIAFPSSLSPEAGLFVHSMIRNLQPRVVIETGSYISVSSHWIAAAFQENGCSPDSTRLHCFDDFGPIHKGPWRDAEMLSGRKEWVTDRLTRAGLYDYVTLHAGDSSSNLVAARGVLADQGGVDFAFIDGDHSVEGALKDFHAVEPVLNTGGFILLHDTFPDQCGEHMGPRHILDHFNAIGEGLYEKVELYLSPLNYGLGLLRRIG